MAETTLIFADPIAARWPEDSAAGVLEDLVWGLGDGHPARYVPDDLMLEKLRLIAAALRPVAVTVYDAEQLGRMTATTVLPKAPLKPESTTS